MRWLSSCAWLLAFLTLSPALSAEGVRIVEPTGTQSFPDLQQAIDAASDGDVLLVGAGNYGSFAIDGKSLWIAAVPGALVRVEGTAEVRNLAAVQTVVLIGLTVEPPTPASGLETEGTALWLEVNEGHVRLQRCTFLGATGEGDGDCQPTGHIDGWDAVRAVANQRIAFVGCTMRGGSGASIPFATCYESPAGDGGHGVHAESSPIAHYDCGLFGGAGGEAGIDAGDGGDGYHAPDFGVFGSGTSFTGGDGGFAWDFIKVEGGDGGDGCHVATGQMQFLDCAFTGGAAGGTIPNICCPGAPGEEISGNASLTIFPGSARVLTAPALTSDAATWSVQAQGETGDRMHFPSSATPFFLPLASFRGVALVPLRFLSVTPLAVAPGEDPFPIDISLPDQGPAHLARLAFSQGLAYDALGDPVLGSPLHAAILDRAGTPDCDGDVVLDYLAVAEGLVPDCDTDLVPDACAIASGAVPDCNENGVPDSCDIAGGASLDVDQDGVPDECQVQHLTWWVDDSAAPGGDGSAASPFRTLREGLNASFTGDTVIVKPGLYVGPDNRGLDFGGLDIVVKSQFGPGGCTIDCEDQDRAFLFQSVESNAARVQGFTVRNGRTFSGIEQRGAAIEIRNGSAPTIVDCHFRSCSAYGVGGAVAVYLAAPRILRCRFIDNHSDIGGGALFANTKHRVVVSHCRFQDNTATTWGGAIYVVAADPDPSGVGALHLDDCLFTGNSATTSGGAIRAVGIVNMHGRCFVTSSTFSGNSSSMGGAVILEENFDFMELADSIFWGDSAATGPELAIDAPSGAPPELRVAYCDVQGGAASIFVNGGTLSYGPGNVALDPLFVDPGAGGYDLAPGSPCVDAGDVARMAPDRIDLDGDGDTTEPVPFDLDLGPRRVDDPAAPDTGAGPPPIVDMGAFEREP